MYFCCSLIWCNFGVSQIIANQNMYGYKRLCIYFDLDFALTFELNWMLVETDVVTSQTKFSFLCKLRVELRKTGNRRGDGFTDKLFLWIFYIFMLQ